MHITFRKAHISLLKGPVHPLYSPLTGVLALVASHCTLGIKTTFQTAHGRMLASASYAENLVLVNIFA